MKVLHPHNMGVITPKNEGNVALLLHLAALLAATGSAWLQKTHC